MLECRAMTISEAAQAMMVPPDIAVCGTNARMFRPNFSRRYMMIDWVAAIAPPRRVQDQVEAIVVVDLVKSAHESIAIFIPDIGAGDSWF